MRSFVIIGQSLISKSPKRAEKNRKIQKKGRAVAILLVPRLQLFLHRTSICLPLSKHSRNPFILSLRLLNSPSSSSSLHWKHDIGASIVRVGMIYIHVVIYIDTDTYRREYPFESLQPKHLETVSLFFLLYICLCLFTC